MGRLLKNLTVVMVLLTCLAVALFFAKVGFSAQKQESSGYLGVRLMPVPEMVAVHLGLDEDEGQMVVNVVKDGPADQAGLVRYDVIIRIDGQKVDGYEAFVEKIRSAGAGTEVKLTLINKGSKRDIAVTMAAEPADELEWKYAGPVRRGEPAQPRESRPGRWHRLQPTEPEDQPFDLPDELQKFFRREYHFRYEPDNGEGFRLPDEQTQQKMQQLEKRLSVLEQQQAEILKRLDKLLEEK